MNDPSTYHNIHIHIFAEGYINIGVPLDADSKNVFKLHSISKLFEQQLWLNGRPTGWIKGKLFIETTAFIQQMACGVLTENGVAKSSSIFKANSKEQYRVKVHPKIQFIKKYKDAIMDSAFTILEKKTITETLHYNLTQNLKNLETTLKESERESLISFIYEGKGELMKGQEILIETGLHLVEYCKVIDLQFKEDYYQSLIFLLKRGELNLEYIGFDVSEQQKVQASGDKAIAYKVEIALKFQQFMYNSLTLCLELFQQKALENYEREFIMFCIATSYFSIPEFRDSLLTTLRDIHQVELEEWFEIRSKYDERFVPTMIRETSSFQKLVNWENEFFKHISHTDGYKNAVQDLKIRLENQDWKRRFSKKGIGFFFFINEVCKYVKSIVVLKDNIPWSQVPGYGVLLKNFLVELNKREVGSYPDALIQASESIMFNFRLLSVMTKIILQKTK